MDSRETGKGSRSLRRFEAGIQDKLKNYFLSTNTHHMVPGYNLSKNPHVDQWDAENALGLFQQFPYNCELPKPLLPPVKLPRNVLEEEDPAVQIISAKSHMDSQISTATYCYTKNKKALTRVHKKEVRWTNEGTVKHTSLPRYIADLSEIIELDPDPYFQGTYNWYHTGGSLHSLRLSGSNVLLFPYSNELVATPIVDRGEYLWKVNLKNAAKCDITREPFELKSRTSDSTCKILGRYKHNCIVYTLSANTQKLELIEIHSHPSDLPYTSADLNQVNTNQYCTVTVDRAMILWDLIREKPLSKYTIITDKILEDNWTSIKCQQSDPNVVTFVDRCCLHFLDTRVPYEKPVLTLCPKSNLEVCESLCLDFQSRNNAYRYVGTYHSFFLCDSRSPNAFMQQKWTHQFKSAPLFAGVCNRDEHEIIALSSQISGEKAIILNTWLSKDRQHSYNLPYTPPSILETLTTSQKRGMCLDPSMSSRLQLCTNGCTLVKGDDNHVFLFSQNSIGDIFYQCLTHEEPIDEFSVVNCKSYHALEAWERSILAQGNTIKPLVVTETANMRHVYDNFTNRQLRLQCSEVEEAPFDAKWKQSLQKLHDYKDLLAPELLAVWEISEESVPLPLSAAPHQKVLSWLERSAGDVKMEEPEYILPTPLSEPEFISVSQEPNVIHVSQTVDNVSVQELNQFYIKSRSSQKRSTKKKKYISGF